MFKRKNQGSPYTFIDSNIFVGPKACRQLTIALLDVLEMQVIADTHPVAFQFDVEMNNEVVVFLGSATIPNPNVLKCVRQALNDGSISFGRQSNWGKVTLFINCRVANEAGGVDLVVMAVSATQWRIWSPRIVVDVVHSCAKDNDFESSK